MKHKLIPHEVILVGSIPNCVFCEQEGVEKPGPYDFKTVMGPWANGCYDHYRYHGAYGTLGTGKGQLWVTEDQVLPDTEPADEGEVVYVDGPSGRQPLEWYADSGNFDGDLVDLL